MDGGHLSTAERADLAHHLRVKAAAQLVEASGEFVRAISALHDEGEPIKRIAERYGLTRQRVYTLLEQGPPLASTRGIAQLEGWAATDHRPQTDQAATRLGVAGAPFERQLEALRRSSEAAESEGLR